MSDDLLAALKAAGDEFKAARASLDQARETLLPLMVKALLEPGVKQRQVVELSGYTRESVRGLARKHGIEPE